jgi:hypothetical protein
MNDYYYFYDSSRPESSIHAYFSRWINEMGETKPYFIYTREQIEKLALILPETKKKRLLNLKKGSNLKMSRLHSCGDLMIRRTTEEEVSVYCRMEELNKEKETLDKKILEQTKALHEKLKIVKKSQATLNIRREKLRPKR